MKQTYRIKWNKLRESGDSNLQNQVQASFTSLCWWLDWLLCLEKYSLDGRLECVFEESQRGTCPLYCTIKPHFSRLNNVLAKIFNESCSDWFRVTTYIPSFSIQIQVGYFLPKLVVLGLEVVSFMIFVGCWGFNMFVAVLWMRSCRWCQCGVLCPNNFCHNVWWLGSPDFLLC